MPSRSVWLTRMSIGASLLFFSALLAAALSFYFAHLNGKLDALHGPSRLTRHASGYRGGPRYWVRSADETGGEPGEEGRKGLERADDVLDLDLLHRLGAGAESKDFRYIT
jgi:hypothetical protein